MNNVVTGIEIINNTRGDIEVKIWERGDWGGGRIQVPDVHPFTMSQAQKRHFRRVFLLFEMFFFLKILKISTSTTTRKKFTQISAVAKVVAKEALAQPISKRLALHPGLEFVPQKTSSLLFSMKKITMPRLVLFIISMVTGSCYAHEWFFL